MNLKSGLKASVREYGISNVTLYRREYESGLWLWLLSGLLLFWFKLLFEELQLRELRLSPSLTINYLSLSSLSLSGITRVCLPSWRCTIPRENEVPHSLLTILKGDVQRSSLYDPAWEV